MVLRLRRWDANKSILFAKKKPLIVFPTWLTSLHGGHTLPEHWTETGFGRENSYITVVIDNMGKYVGLLLEETISFGDHFKT